MKQCRTHQLPWYYQPLWRGGYLPQLELLQSYDIHNVNVNMLPKYWKTFHSSLLLSLPGLLGPRVVAPSRFLPMGQIKLNCVHMLNWIVGNRTVYMYKNRFSINNIQWLMCHETKPNRTRPNLISDENWKKVRLYTMQYFLSEMRGHQIWWKIGKNRGSFEWKNVYSIYDSLWYSSVLCIALYYNWWWSSTSRTLKGVRSPFHYHYSQIHSDLEWLYLLGSYQ